jgi:thiamine-phosphate pyrophosphorylase
MKLVVISPESADSREIEIVRAMLGHGLMRYHVRKPSWTEEQLIAWSAAFSPAERQRFVLHGDEPLARRLGFGGAHWRDEGADRVGDDSTGSAGASPALESSRVRENAGVSRCNGQGPRAHERGYVGNAGEAPALPVKAGTFLRSRSCHVLESVRKAIGVYDAVFLSPVFPSLSKSGYGETRAWTDIELQDLLASRDAPALCTEVIALGGIQKSTTARCRELGFDGAAALGAIWRAVDPVAAFVELRDAFSAFAERPLLAGKKTSGSNFS